MIHVVGGTYLERCREPSWDLLFGSGLRAAIQLRVLGSQTHLHTLVGNRERSLLESLSAQHGIRLTAAEVRRTISFDYDHGLSVPVIMPDARRNDYRAARATVELKAGKIVCFGMIEGEINIEGQQVVYDPQSPTAPASFRKNVGRADRLAIIANRAELRQLSRSANVETACRKILLNDGAEVVVAKMGPAGCVVTTKRGVTHVPAFQTKAVFPIGSGDIFSAAFARAWIDDRVAPATAARFASKAAALYCQTQLPHQKRAINSSSLKPLRFLPRSKHKQVYLAGPFFNVGQRWVIEEVRTALLGCGLKVFSPLHDVGHGEAEDVYGPDMKGLEESQVVIACLDGLDSGTLYEIGYAQALRHKIIVLVGPEREEDLKMIRGGGCTVVRDLTTAIYLSAWAASCE